MGNVLTIIAIIQARMGSSRLPGKVLTDIEGKTMLERVIERVGVSQLVDKIVVATTNLPEDDILEQTLRNKEICDVYRGSVDDVLARFYECGNLYAAEVVVRVTADDPLKDSQIIDKALNLLLSDTKLDYCSNTLELSFPEGLDVEVMRFNALERAHFEAKLASEREHVTPYIWKHPDVFDLLNFKFDRDLSDWRWTVDKPEDLEFMANIFREFRNSPFVSYQEVINWLETNPKIREINTNIIRNEGYLKSINLEKK
jgi:spore coat polysaccharide biosynthesis protein SpsF